MERGVVPNVEWAVCTCIALCIFSEFVFVLSHSLYLFSDA